MPALEPIETASRDELQALQLRRLRWSLRHAHRNVPHYRQSFDTAGVHPENLHTLADLRRFPFTTKADLRDNNPFGTTQIEELLVLQAHVGVSVHVTLADPFTLQRSAGKACRVLDRRHLPPENHLS